MKRILSIVLLLILFFSLFSVSASAANTAKRHTACVSLSSQAAAYYTGSYTYDTLSALDGGTSSCLDTVDSELFEALHDLMTDTMTQSVSYKSLTGHWPITDGNMLFYSDVVSSSYNREHVWPKSHASFYESNGGSDLHHLRPTNSAINSARGNSIMGYVKGVVSGCSTKTNSKGETILWCGNNLVEVKDNIKGDVARILLYVYVRWEEPNLFEDDPNPVIGPSDDKNDGGKVIESLSTLLKWMKTDPVDEWEMARNDLVQDIQGNRNVFIDYPELAWLLFGEEVPSGITTPSGKASNGSSGDTTCTHSSTVIRNDKEATCTTEGYTGDKYCTSCGKKLSSGSAVTAYGHKDSNGDDQCDRCGASTGTSTVTGTHFVKVTTAPSDWSGTYLIVYEDGQKILDGTRTTLDAASNFKDVTISNQAIDIDAKYAFVIEAVSGGYSIKSGSGYYIGNTSSTANGLKSSQTTVYANTLSWDKDGSVHILSGGNYLRYNASSGQDRFRYYKSSTYTNQQPVTLYKLVSDNTECDHSWGTGKVTTQPGCETQGVRTYTCSVCKITKTETISATGHINTELRNQKDAACIESGYTGDTYCKDCGDRIQTGSTVSATGHADTDKNNRCDNCNADLSTGCAHSRVETQNAKNATCTESGYTGDTFCKDCGEKLSTGTVIAVFGHKDGNNDSVCDACHAALNANCDHRRIDTRNAGAASCTTEGYTGDLCCEDCGMFLSSGQVIPATGHADTNSDNACDSCGTSLDSETVPPTEETVPPATEGTLTTVPATGPATVPTEDIPAMNTKPDPDGSSPVIWIVIAALVLLAAGIAVFIVIKKKKTTEQ